MEPTKNELLNNALVALNRGFGFQGDIAVSDTDSGDFDAAVNIMNVGYLCEIKENVTPPTFNIVLQDIRTKAGQDAGHILLVTRYVSPDLLCECAENGINVIDSAGNFFIRHIKDGQIVFQVSNSGKKDTGVRVKRHSLFGEAGIKVIFYFLNDFKKVSRPYREIQKATGVSIGSVKNIMDELISMHYVLVTGKGRFLKNSKKLLEQWTISYNQVLKPRLLLDRMSFRSTGQRIKWLAMELPEGMYWGGESAAQMVNTYLEPEKFDIYTDIPAANLMRTGFVERDIDGEISIYRKFWNWETENKLAPLVLIYADLLGSGYARCLETAQKILDNGLNYFK